MKLSKMMTAAAISLLFSLNSGAQQLGGAYFLDDFVYSYEMNPAMHDAKTTRVFVGFLLNDITIGAHTNVGLSTFLYPKPMDSNPDQKELVLFMNEKVSYDEFVGKLPANDIRVNPNINLNLLSFGFKAGKNGFFSFDSRLKSRTKVTVSTDILKEVKSGLEFKEGSEINMKNLDMYTREYIELAADYSHKVGNVRLGIAAKFLMGLAAADASLKNIGVKIGDDQYFATGDINAAVSTTMLGFPAGPTYDFNNIGFGKVGFSGFGGAVDLGVHYEAPFGLILSASVLDLGVMSWKNTISGEASFNNTLIEEVKDADANYYANTLLHLDRSKEGVANMEMLPMTINAGIRYKMPFYKGLSIGVHGSYVTKLNAFDARVGLTLSPCRWFSISGNYGITDYGAAFGAAMNLRPGPFTFFVGMDGFISKFTPQGIPVNALNTVAKVGILVSVKTPNEKKNKK
ncbi:MAG: hypothetical protein J5764_02640 [Bacteroidales bacterium]|nr:hypothetical protein [Bacteroidales bacterium]